MSRNILIFLAFLFLMSAAISLAQSEKTQSPEYIFNKANYLYEEAKYDEAIAEYSSLLNEGFEDGTIYYNLGNCYFKNGKLGKAILNYERARRLIPRDKDLQSNYEYARSLIKDTYSVPRKIWIFRIIDNFFNQFTIDGITILLSLTYTIAMILIVARVVFKFPKIYARMALLVLAVFFTLTAVIFYNRISILKKEAIIVQEKADAKFEPFERATIYFTLYEGMKVQVAASKGDWSKVRRSDGKAGWIKNEAFELI